MWMKIKVVYVDEIKVLKVRKVEGIKRARLHCTQMWWKVKVVNVSESQSSERSLCERKSWKDEIGRYKYWRKIRESNKLTIEVTLHCTGEN